MASQLTPTPQWHDTLTIIETTDPVEGGQNGIDNKPHIELAQNIAFVKKELDELNIPADQSAAVTTIKQDLQTEISQRKQADTALNNRIDSLPAQVDYSAQITALQNQIDILKNNGTGGVTAVAVTQCRFVAYVEKTLTDGKYWQNKIYLCDDKGFAFKPASDLTSNLLTLALPAWYDNNLYEVVVTHRVGYTSVLSTGSITVDEANKVINFTDFEAGMIEVLLRRKQTSNVGSGILVSTLEVYYYRDGDIIVPNETKILEKTGLVIQHQEVVSMPTSLITPEQRVAYITFTLPAEYDSSKHRLVVRTDNGSYTIDNQNKKIVFKVIVSTYHRDNASASTETKFAATLRVEIYNL